MQAAGIEGFSRLGIEGARAMVDASSSLSVGPPVASVTDRTMGATATPVRMYRDGHDRSPVVVFFHGGGWALGSLESHDALCRHLAAETGATVVAVDYRLAPEDAFPAAVDDAWSVLEAILDGDSTGFDRTRVAVVGDSAGGNLAAATAQLARDAGHALTRQVLIYPVIDRRLDRPSMIENGTGYVLEAADMAWFWRMYDPEGRSIGDPRAEPIQGRLAGLAPALVITAEHDPLRDEGEEYAALLEAARVPTTLRRFDGTFHGFAAAPGFLDCGDEALELIVTTLRHDFDHR